MLVAALRVPVISCFIESQVSILGAETRAPPGHTSVGRLVGDEGRQFFSSIFRYQAIQACFFNHAQPQLTSKLKLRMQSCLLSLVRQWHLLWRPMVAYVRSIRSAYCYHEFCTIAYSLSPHHADPACCDGRAKGASVAVNIHCLCGCRQSVSL